MPTTPPAFADLVPPQNLEAERAVLGAALQDAESLALLLARLPVETFFLDAHRRLRACLERLHADDMPVDLLTVRAALAIAGDLEAVGGPAALAGLVEEAATAIHVDAYSTLILEAAAKRELIAIAGALLHEAHNGTAPAAITQARVLRRQLDDARAAGRLEGVVAAAHGLQLLRDLAGPALAAAAFARACGQ